MRRLLILIIFFLTGASALIYQVTWVRQATLVFGVSIYAYSVVLAAFMGGMALGSYALGKRADRVVDPLRFFALLQVGIALCGAAIAVGLPALMPLYATLVQSAAAGSLLLTAVRAGLAILILTPATFLMGATLPVLTKAVARAGRVGSDVGVLYAADTLGAAIGCGLTGLFLLRLLGTWESVLVAVGLNALAALLAWGVGWRQRTSPAIVMNSVGRDLSGFQNLTGLLDKTKTKIFPTDQAVLWAYAISGFVALGYEVVWARVLAIFTLNATFSFAIMLTTFLTGLTVGGWLGAWWVRNRRATLAHFAYLQSAVGLAALLTLLSFARLPRLSLEALFGVYSVTNVVAFEFLLGFLTLFLPTLLLGMLFPLAVSLYTQERAEGSAGQVGRLLAFNTAGGVLGSLAIGFGLIPLLGLQLTGVLLAAINLSLAVALNWMQSQSWQATKTVVVLVSAVAGVLLFIALPPGYYLGFREEPSEQMVFYAEGVETTVAVFEVPEHNFKVSFVNGRIEVPTDEISMNAFRLLGHLPAILRPDAQRALMLSFGNGIATGSLDSHHIPYIDAVDLSAEQFAAAEIYWIENYNVLRSPRLHTHVEDGRNFLLQTPYRYEIITTDATHPVNTSSWALFTQEFYQSVHSRLTDDGVFVQWLPFHNLIEPDYQQILRTFQAVFPHATLWYTGGTHTLLVATPNRLTAEELVARLQRVANDPIVKDDLGPALTIGSSWLMDEDGLRTYAGAGALTTDNNAYFLPQDRDNERLLQMMQGLARQAQAGK